MADNEDIKYCRVGRHGVSGSDGGSLRTRVITKKSAIFSLRPGQETHTSHSTLRTLINVKQETQNVADRNETSQEKV